MRWRGAIALVLAASEVASLSLVLIGIPLSEVCADILRPLIWAPLW